MNTETLDRPVETLVEIAPAKTTTALAAIEMQAVALARFGDWRAGAAALVKKFAAVVFDCSTTKGMKEAEAARAEVRAPRYAAQRVATNSKTELASISRAVGAEEKEIIAALAETEAAIDSQIAAEVERKAAAKLEAARLDAERKARHEAGIARIAGLVGAALGKTAAQIQRGVEYAEDMDMSGWEEFTAAATTAQANAVGVLRQMAAGALAAEAQAAELVRAREEQRVEAERLAAEAERQRAELAESKRVADERERVAAEALRVEAAAIKSAADARAKIVADEQRAAAAEVKRIADEQAKAAAEVQAAAAAKLAADRAEFDAQQLAAANALAAQTQELQARRDEFAATLTKAAEVQAAAAAPAAGANSPLAVALRAEWDALPVVANGMPSWPDEVSRVNRFHRAGKLALDAGGVRGMCGDWSFDNIGQIADLIDAAIAEHAGAAA